MTNFKYLLFLIAFGCYFSVSGQMRYGSVEYEIKVNLDKRFPASENTNFKGRNRSGFNTTTKVNYLLEKATLYFTDSISLYITEPMENSSEQRKTFTTNTFIDLTAQKLTTQINLLGEIFQIEDSLPKRIWKYTDKVRDIAGVECPQVFTELHDGTKIYAWFSPEVIPAVGPESYGNLPGVILGLAYEDGSVTYFATKISRNYPDALANYTLPSNRKKYSREAFYSEFVTKYNSNNRYYKLIQDLLHFY